MPARFYENGKQTSERRYHDDGSVDWAVWNTRDATYDANGNLLTETRYNKDGIENYWIEYIYLNRSAPEKAE